jgi:hypothetical protein
MEPPYSQIVSHTSLSEKKENNPKQELGLKLNS